MYEFKKILLPLLAVFAMIIFVGFLQQKKSILTYKSAEIKIDNIKIKAKIADTEAKRETGLSPVSSLADDEGMLFVFEKKDVQPSFWMKDMQTAIDIIWINDGKVVKIDKNIQPPKPDTKDEDLKRYQPAGAVDYVLEVASGFSDKNEIKINDLIEISETNSVLE